MAEHTTQTPVPQRGWFQRSVWILDSYSRLATLISLLGTAVGMGVIATSVAHSASKWTLPWVITLGVGIGLLAAVITMLALANWIGGRIVASHAANACSVTPNKEGGMALGASPLVLTNTDPTWSILPMRIRLRGIKVDKKRKPSLDSEGLLTLLSDEHGPLAPAGSANYSVVFVLPLEDQPSVVSAKVDVQDQFLRWSRGRGRIKFKRPNRERLA